MMSFFQSHYEKIILASLLVIFAVLLVWQVNFLQAGQSQNVDNIINKVEPDSDQAPYDFSQEKFKIPRIFLDDVAWHPKAKVNEPPHQRTDLFSSFHLSVCPFCFNLIASANFPEEGSRDVKKCPLCGKDLKARQKKTEHKEEEIDLSATGTQDKNSNEVPDAWEKANGVYAENNAAIHEDPDGDGFTTYEEYVLKTNPLDPKSHPRYIAYTTVMKVERKMFGVLYKGLASPDREIKDLKDLELNIQFKEPGKRVKKRPKKLGQKFQHRRWTFEIVDVVPDDPKKPGQGTVIYVCREGYKEKIKCERDKEVYDPVETVELWVAPYRDKNPVSCQVGKTFKLGDERTGVEEYTLVSAGAGTAVVQDSKGKKFQLGKYVEGAPIVEKSPSADGNPEGSASGVSNRDRDLPPPLEAPSSSSKKQR